MKVHPYAELFPAMTEPELDALAADIAEHGLRQPVIIYDKQVLDGRNRLAACKRAGVEPAFVEHEGDDASALALVISLNAQRRDLTAGQRAIVAARTWGLDEKKVGRPAKGKTSQSATFSVKQLARQFRVSDNTIAQARDLLANAPDLAEQVERRLTSLAAACEAWEEREEEARKKAKRAERVAEYMEAISAGEMTMEEALDKVMEAEQEEKERASARQLWLKGMADVLKWVRTWVSPVTDEHLAWYAEPGARGTERDFEAPDVREAIRQLERVIRFTLRG